MNTKKIETIVLAIMIGLGFYSLAGIITSGLTLAKFMSLAGVVVVAAFVEWRCTTNVGIYLVLSIGRDALAGLGSLTILALMPFEMSEKFSVIVMLAVTAYVAITMSDDGIDTGAEK